MTGKKCKHRSNDLGGAFLSLCKKTTAEPIMCPFKLIETPYCIDYDEEDEK